MSPLHALRALCGLSLWLASNPLWSAINSPLPGDFTALPKGATSITSYYLHNSVQQYQAGATGPFSGTYTSAVVRVSHYRDLADERFSLVAIAPVAKLALEGPLPPGMEHAPSGVGDLRLGFTWYPIHDLDRRHHLGINLMQVLPTGRYVADQPFNIGENRQRTALSLGWIRSITPHWTLDLMAEYDWFGDNPEAFNPLTFGHARLTQAPSQALTAYISYHPDRINALYLGSEWNWGGEQSLDGVPLDNASELQRLYLGGVYFLTPDRLRILNLRLTQDAHMENGFAIEHGLTLRFIYLIE